MPPVLILTTSPIILKKVQLLKKVTWQTIIHWPLPYTDCEVMDDGNHQQTLQVREYIKKLESEQSKPLTLYEFSVRTLPFYVMWHTFWVPLNKDFLRSCIPRAAISEAISSETKHLLYQGLTVFTTDWELSRKNQYKNHENWTPPEVM